MDSGPVQTMIEENEEEKMIGKMKIGEEGKEYLKRRIPKRDKWDAYPDYEQRLLREIWRQMEREVDEGGCESWKGENDDICV